MTSLRLRLALVSLALALICLFSTFGSAVSTAAETPLLLRNPSLSQDRIAFLYADDVWTVSRQGGEAERLTANGHVDAGPIYSPDGAWIAYSAHLNGNTDVYVIPANGGVPRRITWHPSGSYLAGWTPDGKDLLIVSGQASYRDYVRLFRVHADGSGVPEPLPLPTGIEGSFSPDGNSLAYQPITKWQPAWKRYVGGQTTPIWIVNLKTLDLVKVPRDNSNDSNPVWVGNSVYFLSDRGKSGPGPISLFRYDTESKEVTQVVANTGYDLKSFQAGPGGLVYEQFGSIHFFDLAANTDKTVSIQVHGELASLAPHRAAIAPDEIQNAGLSPTGARAVFEAHGEIFTVPAEKGDTRNLTQTPGVAERDPSWSPDGKTIAYFSDASGEYQLYLHDQTGFKPPTVIDLGPEPSFFYSPTWSPDSKHIAYTDKHLRLWYVDVPAGKPVLVDKGIYGSFGPDFGAIWSPDSKWIAYHRDLDNQLRRRLPLFAGNAQIHPGNRRHERCLQPGVRPQRQVSLLPRLHRRRPFQGGHRSFFARPRADHRRLRRGAGQGRRVAHCPRERRREDQGRDQEGRQGKDDKKDADKKDTDKKDDQADATKKDDDKEGRRQEGRREAGRGQGRS